MSDNSISISILGSTGSIGVQSLDVLSLTDENYKVNYLVANTKIDLLAEQAHKFKPAGVAIKDEKSYYEFKRKYSFGCKVLCGDEGVNEAAADPGNDIILQALVGFSGVKPTLSAIENNIKVALANKETLVSAGKLITDAAKTKAVDIIAVDSEHSAVLQCLVGESKEDIEKIILTASGGPFFNSSDEDLSEITVKKALDHPNWKMGNKITIDSATMMNKGFEVIEAHWLFEIEPEKIDVIIHPQSIIHSLVRFVDGSVKAQLGIPDMRIPISYALSYPKRMNLQFPALELTEIGKLEFFKPDFRRFRCLALAYDALKDGGSAPVILNAANEIAVQNFLDEKINFFDIPNCIEYSLNKIPHQFVNSVEEIEFIDTLARETAKSFITNL